MPIEPDDKDWTWVLDGPCPECGLDTRDVAPTDVGARTRATIPAWQAVLARADARTRPAPSTWSPLEYGCHVRDVFALFHERLDLMLAEDDPVFANWDQDVTAVEDDYGSQDPAQVSRQLAAAGTGVADAFDAVRDDQWERPATRSNGSRFTVATFSRYFLHDVEHHLRDVGGA